MSKTSQFDYELDHRLIAQTPLADRDASQLLILDRRTGQISHSYFYQIDEFFHKGDVVVVNDSRVIPARLLGRKSGTGGKIELLLLEKVDGLTWRSLVGGKRITQGTRIELVDEQGRLSDVSVEIIEELGGSQRLLAFDQEIDGILDQIGRPPVPPYIHESLSDNERYQTIYSRYEGSAAAPTAGLHFTADILLSLRKKGVLIETVTLHIGLDTFQPVRVNEVADHKIHSEWARLTADSARRINEAKLSGGRIIAVGTTVVRVLESAALLSAGISGGHSDITARDSSGETFQICPWRPVAAFEGRTDLFIYPGYRFRAVDAMITNFHLPRSTLLMLVSAFAGREEILSAYRQAMEREYRFYSFGDAMLIL